MCKLNLELENWDHVRVFFLVIFPVVSVPAFDALGCLTSMLGGDCLPQISSMLSNVALASGVKHVRVITNNLYLDNIILWILIVKIERTKPKGLDTRTKIHAHAAKKVLYMQRYYVECFGIGSISSF